MALTGLSLNEDDVDERFQTDRASNADASGGTEFRDEDIGDAANTWMNSEGVLCGPLDRDRFFIADTLSIVTVRHRTRPGTLRFACCGPRSTPETGPIR
jgi:hypothetical protein